MAQSNNMKVIITKVCGKEDEAVKAVMEALSCNEGRAKMLLSELPSCILRSEDQAEVDKICACLEKGRLSYEIDRKGEKIKEYDGSKGPSAPSSDSHESSSSSGSSSGSSHHKASGSSGKGPTTIVVTAFKDIDEAAKAVAAIRETSESKAKDRLGELPCTILKNVEDQETVEQACASFREAHVSYELQVDGSVVDSYDDAKGGSSSHHPSSESHSESHSDSSSGKPSSGGIKGPANLIVTAFKDIDEAAKAVAAIRETSESKAKDRLGELPSTILKKVEDQSVIDKACASLREAHVSYELQVDGSVVVSYDYETDVSCHPDASSHDDKPEEKHDDKPEEKHDDKPEDKHDDKPAPTGDYDKIVKVIITAYSCPEKEAMDVICELRGCTQPKAKMILDDLPFTILRSQSRAEVAACVEKLKEHHFSYEVPDSDIESHVAEGGSSSSASGEGGEPQSAEEKLQAMIGLGSVKAEVVKIKAYCSKNEGKKINTHMFFVGNPGTGKTVVARLFAEILYEAHALPKKKFVEVSAKDLIAGYVGQTAILTGKKIEEAMGGVLFVDEAYSLHPEDKNSFGQECIDTLMKAMEDHRGEICVIFAGYKEDMRVLLESNPGFESRVKFHVPFDDYTDDELRQIGGGFIAKEDYKITDAAMDSIMQIVTMQRFSKNFGNARTIRSIIEDVMMIQAVRTKDNREDRTLDVPDVQEYARQKQITLIDETTAGKSDAMSQLSSLIGLSSVKDTINDLISYFTVNKGRKIDFHMSFLGNPGTGKTVVARIIGKLLHQEGLLPSDTFVECTSSDLIAEYIGQTAPKTKAMIEKAMGGVLFVDEAYTLAGKDASSAVFGKEAIAELLKSMEDRRGDFCVIMAGYTKEMKELMDVNPGLQSRVKFELEFPDYSEEELCGICKMYLKKDDYTMSDDLVALVAKLVYAGHRDRNYANARSLREAISKIEIKQAGRVAHDDPNSRELTLEDIKKVFGEEKVSKLLGEGKDAVTSDNAGCPMVSLAGLEALYRLTKPRPFEEAMADIGETVIAIKTETGESSGFIFSEDGYIGTCAHCVRGAKEIDVRTRIVYRGRNIDAHYPARVVVIDEPNDCAIIKIDSKDPFVFTPLAPRDQADLPPLSRVFIMGYPFGVTRFDTMSVNEGKIASYQRGRSNQPDQINLDISAKGGNSGSLIVDAATGFVLGILCGSSTSGHAGGLIEEINYCRPISYLWDLIVAGQKKDDGEHND